MLTYQDAFAQHLQTIKDDAIDCFAHMPDEVIQFLHDTPVTYFRFYLGNMCYVGLAARYQYTKNTGTTVSHQKDRIGIISEVMISHMNEYLHGIGLLDLPVVESTSSYVKTAHQYFGGSLESWHSLYENVANGAYAGMIYECFATRLSTCLSTNVS